MEKCTTTTAKGVRCSNWAVEADKCAIHRPAYLRWAAEKRIARWVRKKFVVPGNTKVLTGR